jgi:hypothetical protein
MVNLEGCGHVLINVLPHNLHNGSEENHRNSEDSLSSSQNLNQHLPNTSLEPFQPSSSHLAVSVSDRFASSQAVDRTPRLCL